MTISDVSNNVAERAKQSLGGSSDPVYQMVAKALNQLNSGGVLVDVGCGSGKLWSFVSDRVDRYFGVDVVCYDGLPEAIEFIPFDLDSGKVSLSEGIADIVCAVEVIEHLENPRAFVRELVRLVKPGGFVICLLYTSPSPRDRQKSRMPSSA